MGDSDDSPKSETMLDDDSRSLSNYSNKGEVKTYIMSVPHRYHQETPKIKHGTLKIIEPNASAHDIMRQIEDVETRTVNNNNNNVSNEITINCSECCSGKKIKFSCLSGNKDNKVHTKVSAI
jgi:hypothetical protein